MVRAKYIVEVHTKRSGWYPVAEHTLLKPYDYESHGAAEVYARIWMSSVRPVDAADVVDSTRVVCITPARRKRDQRVVTQVYTCRDLGIAVGPE